MVPSMAKAISSFYLLQEDICCKNCGAINRYEITNEAMMNLTGELFSVLAAMKAGQPLKNSRLDFGVGALADGTTVKSLQDAVEHYARKVQEEPDRSELRILWGKLLRKDDQIDEALEQYATACQLDSRSIEAHYNLLTLYGELKQGKNAVGVGMKLLEIEKKGGNFSEDELDMLQRVKDIMMAFAPELVKSKSLFNTTSSKNQTTTYRRPEPKIGRNDPCSCGSGKKYKKCCRK
jgi:uncharacterized protein YecA (UPF0149 family)